MFTDPLKPKFDNSAETETPRVSTGDMQSRYLSEDGLKAVEIGTVLTKKGRKRHRLGMILSKLTTNPFDESQKEEVSSTVSIVVDRPVAGFTNEEIRKLAEGLKTLATESNLKKLIASES